MKAGGKGARHFGACLIGTLAALLCVAAPAAAGDIEIVTSRFCDLPANEPIFIDNANMGEDDEAIAARIAAMLRMKEVKVLDDEPDGDGDNLILTFELDRFVPERPDDKSGFGFVVKGASGSGVSARIIVPKLRKDYVFGPMTPKPPPGPILTFDMTLDFGTSRRVWLGRASAPLGHRAPLDLELEMADRLVNALMSPPDDKCVAPPE